MLIQPSKPEIITPYCTLEKGYCPEISQPCWKGSKPTEGNWFPSSLSYFTDTTLTRPYMWFVLLSVCWTIVWRISFYFLLCPWLAVGMCRIPLSYQDFRVLAHRVRRDRQLNNKKVFMSFTNTYPLVVALGLPVLNGFWCCNLDSAEKPSWLTGAACTKMGGREEKQWVPPLLHLG